MLQYYHKTIVKRVLVSVDQVLLGFIVTATHLLLPYIVYLKTTM